MYYSRQWIKRLWRSWIGTDAPWIAASTSLFNWVRNMAAWILVICDCSIMVGICFKYFSPQCPYPCHFDQRGEISSLPLSRLLRRFLDLRSKWQWQQRTRIWLQFMRPREKSSLIWWVLGAIHEYAVFNSWRRFIAENSFMYFISAALPHRRI